MLPPLIQISYLPVFWLMCTIYYLFELEAFKKGISVNTHIVHIQSACESKVNLASLHDNGQQKQKQSFSHKLIFTDIT